MSCGVSLDQLFNCVVPSSLDVMVQEDDGDDDDDGDDGDDDEKDDEEEEEELVTALIVRSIWRHSIWRVSDDDDDGDDGDDDDDDECPVCRYSNI